MVTKRALMKLSLAGFPSLSAGEQSLVLAYKRENSSDAAYMDFLNRTPKEEFKQGVTFSKTISEMQDLVINALTTDGKVLCILLTEYNIALAANHSFDQEFFTKNSGRLHGVSFSGDFRHINFKGINVDFADFHEAILSLEQVDSFASHNHTLFPPDVQLYLTQQKASAKELS